VGGSEADALSRAGLKEGSANTHPGQGTACRRFFFSNAYLELIWVSDPREARTEAVLETRLWERWSKRSDGACPFGIVLRPADTAPCDPPFASRSYRPSYLPPEVSIEIARDTPLTEPGLFFFSFPHGRPGKALQPTDHQLPIGSLTGVTVWKPAGLLSAAAERLQNAGLISFRSADEYLMELTFDDATIGASVDLRPALSLTLRW